MRRVLLVTIAAVVGMASLAGTAAYLSSAGYDDGARFSYGLGETDGSFINGIISGIVGLIVAFATANYGAVLGKVAEVLVLLRISHELTPAEQREQFDIVKSLKPPTP